MRMGVLAAASAALLATGATLCVERVAAGDRSFPDLTTKPALPESSVEVVVELPDVAGNLDVAKDGSIYFTLHPAAQPKEGKVFKVIPGGMMSKASFVPYPDKASQDKFITVLSVRVDNTHNQLLLLDHANLGEKPPAVHVVDLKTNKLVKTHTFKPEVAGPGSMLNDMVVAPDGRHLYISDCGIGNSKPAVIVVDMTKGEWDAWRALDTHESTTAKDALPIINGKPIDLPWKVGVDAIAISKDTLYFASVYDTVMWSAPLAVLNDRKADHAKSVRKAGPKTIADGIVADDKFIYVTDFEHNEISAITIHPWKVQTLVHSDTLLRWPDGLSMHNGYLYVSCSAIHELVAGDHKKKAPFHLLRIKLPGALPPAEAKSEL